ncbi:MAG: methylated-DNA--[protein]-cysteine S-methyltransferase [Candidatus Bruticola sp.]
MYVSVYNSPVGQLLLAADEIGLTCINFDSNHFYNQFSRHIEIGENIFISETKRWLDRYFTGQQPDFCPQLHLVGTSFQLKVWDMLKHISYGQLTTYGQLAKQIAADRGAGGKMSAQAVGGAVGRNPIPIIVPCHRVVGAKGNLTGYSGGLDIKRKLLSIEGIEQSATTLCKLSTTNLGHISY